MDKQLNFLNIFDEEKYKKDAANEVEGAGELNMDEGIDEKDILEKDPIEFDKFEEGQKEEADRLIQKNERLANQVSVEDFLVAIKGKEHKLKLSDFAPFLPELNKYHERYQSFRRQFDQSKPGLDKERIYKKMTSPNIEDAPEFRSIATLYLIYIEKLKEFKPKPQEQKPKSVEKTSLPKKREEKIPDPRYGKDGAAGAYLDYRDE